ncbi:MAG TPA: glycosyltransferase family 39 protein, partial [Anaerolineae bacterium]|nr:glycosyltransferase family 39 protein [Anaerolineae bacterium]
GVIVVAYYTVLELFPNRHRLAVAGAALLAFVPTYVFYSGVMSYEPLLALLVGLSFLTLVKIVKGNLRRRTFIVLGLWLGLAVTAKYAAVVLPLEATLVLALLAWRQGWGWRLWLGRLTLSGLAALAACGWWFLFLMIYFNQVDEFGLVTGLLQPIIAGGGDTTQNYLAYTLSGGEIGAVQQLEMASVPFLAWAWQMFQTFWVEKMGTYPLGEVAFGLIGIVCLLTLAGLVRLWWLQPARRPWLALLALHVVLFLALPLVRFVVQGHLVQTAQGRHLIFPIATILPLLFLLGWQAWLPSRGQLRLAGVVAAGLAGWSVAQLFWIQAYYMATYLPIRTSLDPGAVSWTPLNQPFGDSPVLAGYDVDLRPAAGALDLTLYWRSPDYVDEDYRRVVRLRQPETAALVWDTYPANGRYPSRLWESSELILDQLRLPLVDLPAGKYQLEVQLSGADGPLAVNGGEWLSLKTLELPPAEPVAPAFELDLTIAARSVVQGVTVWAADSQPGLTLPEYGPRMAIPIVWQGQPLATERVQWLLVGPSGETYAGQALSARVALFAVSPDWPAGAYRLRAEVWHDEMVVASGETRPLVTIVNERPRRLALPAQRENWVSLEANFANRIKLLGYELPRRSLRAGEAIPLTLYWQGLRTTAKSYTVFTKLFDDHRQQWAGVERLPADGYPTFYWLEQEVVVDSFALPVPPDLPPGVYWLNAGLYEEIDRTATSLPLVIEGQPSDVTSVTFGPVKVGGPPPGLVVSQARPDRGLEVNFGDQIRLVGYDEPRRQGDSLDLTLYWQSLAVTGVDYTAFIHVRDQAGNTVAQADRPPTNHRYPTSVWSPGEIIPDQVLIPLPAGLAAGEYQVVAGLYDFATGQRVPIVGTAEDSLLLLEWDF